VRLRLLIAAAIAAVVTYIALVREEAPAPPRWLEPPPPPPPPPVRVPEPPRGAPAPDAPAPVLADPAPEPLADLVEPEPLPPEPTPEPPPPAAAPTPPDAGARVLEEGRFSLGGWAAAPGHSVVAGVTFRRRIPYPVAAAAVELMVEAADNVAAHGLVVLADPGFAPDQEGFTLLLAAASEGPFSAAGTYLVRSEPRA